MKAREQAQRAVALASDAGERGYEAWARKLLGDVIQEESSNPSEALSHYAREHGVSDGIGHASTPGSHSPEFRTIAPP